MNEATAEVEYFVTNATTAPLSRVPAAAFRRWAVGNPRADYPSSRGGVGTRRIGYRRRDGVARAGRGVWRERFAALRPANFGIGGDRIENVLWRVTAGDELGGLDPKVVVLLVGTNNLAADTPDEVAAGVGAVGG